MENLTFEQLETKGLEALDEGDFPLEEGSARSAERLSLDVGTWNRVKIEVKGNSIEVLVTNAKGVSEKLSFTDDIVFGGGRFGFYSGGASMSYKNLKITG